MTQLNFPKQTSTTRTTDKISIKSLAKSWAKKYTENLSDLKHQIHGGRVMTAQYLMDSLRSASIKAWSETERLLAAEVKRHRINARLIDPWQISQDVYAIYEKSIAAYNRNLIPRRLALEIGPDLGKIREKYTLQDPRIIGFAGMQFHLSGQYLLETLPQLERSRVSKYFKAIDDHLYMPLQRTYEAAANHSEASQALAAVRNLLPASSEIAYNIYQHVIRTYPRYQCYSGSLSDEIVQVSSLRDIEMFQVYLWASVLEESVAPLQQELFPLCLMLYPTLGVSWELVRQLVYQMAQELNTRLSRQQMALFKPYLQVLWDLFSPEVFPDTLSKEQVDNVPSQVG